MKKSVNRSSRGGFTLIEIVVSTALLAVVCTGFLMMTAANAGQLSGEQRLEQSNYNLSALAGEGEGEPTGETIAVEFGLEEENGVREIFEQYEITESEEDTGNCRLPRYLTKPRQRRSEWDMAGSDGISRVSAVFRGKSLLTNKMRII